MIDGNTTLWVIRILFLVLSLTSGYLVWWRWARFDRITSLLLAPLASTIIIIVIGAPLYWIYSFDTQAMLVIIAAFCAVSIIASIWPLPTRQVSYLPIRSLAYALNPFKKYQLPTGIFSLLYLLSALVCIALLIQGRTVDATLGPWERVHELFFIVYGAASFLLLVIGYFQQTKNALYQLLLVIHGFVTLSVLGIIFPLGYGFDPYLHRAAEGVIDQYGVITPKTLYYIGQYVVVVTLSKLLSVPIAYVDVWLVPVLASLSIIPLSVLTIQRLIKDTSMTMVLAALIFIVPFTTIINTTPWSLSFVLFVITLLLVLLYIQKQLKPLLLIACGTTLAALFVHPLGGIPALIVTGIAIMMYEALPRIVSKPLKGVFLISTVILTSILVPLAFLLNSLFSTQLGITIAPPQDMIVLLGHLGTMLFSYFSRFNAWQDIAYVFPFSFGALLIVSAIGVTLYYWNVHRMYRRVLVTLWLCWFAIVINFLLLKGFVQFTSIVSYEQGIFAQRMYDASIIILLPLSIIALHALVRRLYVTSKHYRILKIASLLAFAGLMTSNLYISYPKRDAYNSYHGYTVSAADVATVRWIENDAGNDAHIVLASQVLAAAAIQEFGFKQYFRGEIDGKVQDIFYYPTPTSSPLYADYREMLTDPTQEKADTIMETYNIDRFYVVVNHYEPQYEGTKNKLLAVAAAEYFIYESSSEDTVFVFEKSSNN